MSEDTSSLIPPITGKFSSILIFGPPGSGKGTMGGFLSTAGAQCHLSSGDIFRGIAPESPVGQLFQEYASKGLLVPDEATVEIWRYYVHGLIATNKYKPQSQHLLLDGVPRTPKQAELMDQYIDVKNIIVLDIANRDELFGRIKRRALLEGRADDADDKVLETRFEVYQTQTAKVLSHYPSDLVTTINADQRPLEVLRDILVELSDILSPK